MLQTFLQAIFRRHLHTVGLPWVVLVVKNPPANAGEVRDASSIPGSGRSPGGGQGKPLQYSCLENPHRQRSLAGYRPWGCIVRHN